METKTFKHMLLAGFLSSSAIFAGGVQAATFNVTGSLSGDPRAANPDNLFINVGIDVVDAVASWTVDIVSPLHLDAKLDEFYFNLALSSSEISSLSFSGFSPVGWEILSPASSQGGGQFDPDFLFQAYDPPGSPDAADVTNAVNLSFTTTLNRNWTLDDFYKAAILQSKESALSPGRLGAHLQSLSTANCTSCTKDSGFLVGNYTRDGGGGGGGGGGGSQGNVPEPSVVALLGMGLLGMGLSRKTKG